MSNKKELPLDIISQFSQAEAALINLAPILGSFYQALLKENMPDELARQLVRDYYSDLMNRINSA